MHKLRPTLTAAALAATALPLLAGTAPAAAAATCTVDQLTATSGSGQTIQDLAVSADGDLVAFSSTFDLTGGNADHNFEVFLYDVPEAELTQVTTTAPGIANRGPTVPAAGHTVVYSSNVDGNYEIYRWVGGVIPLTVPVTATGGSHSEKPTVSADGDRIAFESSADIGGANPDGGIDVFLFDVSEAEFTPVTSGAEQDSEAPDISASGNRVAFVSYGDPAGVDEELDYPEVYTYDVDTTTVRQVSHTVEALVEAPSINADGTRVAFASDAAFGAPNPGNHVDLFVADSRAGTTSAMTTSTTDSDQTHAPIIDGTGRRLAYVSRVDGRDGTLLGTEAAQTRDLGGAARNGLVVPGNTQADEEVDIDQTGTHLVTVGNGNPTGENADATDEIFLSTCTAPPPAPTCNGLYASVRLGLGDRPTTGNDVILGRATADVANGKAGNDRFCGLGGNDTFNGGNGADRASGGAGNDRLRGDAGNDRLVGDAGDDVLQGGAGPDTCLGGPGQDTASTCSVRQSIP